MNKQTPEKSEYRADGALQVHSVFHTIQGEGPFTGVPAVFVRLAGCNLQCPKCDTEYTKGRWTDTPESLLDLVQAKSERPGLVVITGGEPLRQDITAFVTLLLRHGYFVQVETNGTLPPPNLLLRLHVNHNFSERRGLYIVCSPKTGSVNQHLKPLVSAYKYVVTDGDINPEDGLPVRVLDHSVGRQVARPHHGFKGPIYVQPADLPEHNDWHLRAAIQSCLRHGYTLQLQLHKIIGLE